MSWIRTWQKPKKICIENPNFPVSEIFRDIPWELSGGTKQACMLASAFILATDVSTVIEIGAWQGFSALILARSLVCNSINPTLITVDINKSAIDRAKAFTKNLPIKHIGINQDSMGLDLTAYTPGLCFIDGDHSYEHCKNDLSICESIMKPFGIIIVHDYSKTGYPGVYRAVNEFIADKGAAKIYIEENRKAMDYRTVVLQLKGDY